MCASWQKHLEPLEVGVPPLPEWGPSKEEILDAMRSSVIMSVAEMGDDVDDDMRLEVEEDTGLVEALHAMELADNFRDEYEPSVHSDEEI